MDLSFAAKEGVGVAITQPGLIERELQNGELVIPFALPVSTGRGYFGVANSGLRTSHEGRRWPTSSPIS